MHLALQSQLLPEAQAAHTHTVRYTHSTAYFPGLLLSSCFAVHTFSLRRMGKPLCMHAWCNAKRHSLVYLPFPF